MQNFNKERFLDLCRWEFTTYKKEYRNTFLFCSALLLLMLLLTSGYITSYGRFEVPYFVTVKARAMAAAMMIIGMAGIASTAFGNMNTTQERLAFLMLPASRIEKYIVRTACRLAVYFVLISVAIIAATFVFALLCLVRTGQFFWAISILSLLHDIIFIGDGAWGCASFILFIIGVWTTYILGSAFFRRRPLVFTTLTVVAFALVMSAVIGFTGVFLAGWLSDWRPESRVTIEFLVDPELIAKSIAFALLLLWNGLNIWASYRLFSKMQVINNRWNNKMK